MYLVNCVMDFKNYFLDNSTRQSKYEDTLPDLGIEENQVIPHENHSKEKKILADESKNFFTKLFTMLTKGYNVVVYGVGCKRPLLEQFRIEKLDKFTTIVVYGYKDNGQRQILTAFQEALDCNKQDEESILTKISKSKRPIFLMIHSIDRLFLRSERIKGLINRILVSPIKNVHLLASVDHINSSLLWTCREVDLLNLYWINFPTFDDYSSEKIFAQLSTSRSSGSAKQRSATATLMAVSNVFDNLPTNSQNIFLQILNFYQDHFAANQLDQQSKSIGRRNNKAHETDESETDEDDENDGRKGQKSSKGFEGYPFTKLYLDCLEAFYVNSEATLKAQLVEFIDHKLIRSRSGSDGSEFIELLIQPKLIPKLLQELSR